MQNAVNVSFHYWLAPSLAMLLHATGTSNRITKSMQPSLRQQNSGENSCIYSRLASLLLSDKTIVSSTVNAYFSNTGRRIFAKPVFQ